MSESEEKDGIRYQLGQLNESVNWLKGSVAALTESLSKLKCTEISAKVNSLERWRQDIEDDAENKTNRFVTMRDLIIVGVFLAVASAVVNGLMVPTVFQWLSKASGG